MPRLPVLLALGLLVPLLGAPVRAQERVAATDQPVLVCRLPAPAEGAAPGVSLPSTAPALRGAPTATFEVVYTGFPADARTAFQAAVDVWAQHVVSSVPIRIDAQWTSLGANLLGSAGPFLIRGFSGAPVPNTWYPNALADALVGRDLRPPSGSSANPDIVANFNSGFGRWYFGTDAPTPPGQVSLFTVVLHELGHGLGFIGSANVDDGIVSGEDNRIECDNVDEHGCFGLPDNSPDVPFIFDRFAEDCEGRSLLNEGFYPDPSSALANVLQDAAFLDGPTIVAANGESAPLHTPRPWNKGSSFSHFAEGAYPVTDPDALMTPVIANGETITSPGPLLCAALQDFGWTLAPACAALIPATPPAPSGRNCEGPPPVPELFALSDNVALRSGRAVFRLAVRDAQAVSVLVSDTRGRIVFTRSLNAVGEGAEERIEIETAGLASGVYLVRVVGEAFDATRRIALVR